MRRAAILAGLAILALGVPLKPMIGTGSVSPSFRLVRPSQDSPGVGAVEGRETGCPLNARIAPFLPPNFDTVGPGMYTNPACITGDPWDKYVNGLVLVKTGPTNNNASAGATLNGVYGISLHELGYDAQAGSGRGHSRIALRCGRPRFNITLADGSSYFLGCNSPPATSQTPGTGWLRLRWGGAPLPLLAFNVSPRHAGRHLRSNGRRASALSSTRLQNISGGPDKLGAAILDNIDVNGALVGRGPNKPHENDRDECNGKDKDHRHFSGHSSKSRPKSNLSFADPGEGVDIQMVNGARSVTSSGTCMSFVGDALFNDGRGMSSTFWRASCQPCQRRSCPDRQLDDRCDPGPQGLSYQKAGELKSGGVKID